MITSKQRPRKLCIRGSNGKDYMFLLKGHEDLRQDERVMQLFGLVNTLLLNDPDTFRRNLTIQRYAVIPLSTNSGLIGWVPHCDTLHTLIRDYREKTKTMLNIEHRIMLRMAPDYDHLTLMQKVCFIKNGILDDLQNTFFLIFNRLKYLKVPLNKHPAMIYLNFYGSRAHHPKFGLIDAQITHVHLQLCQWLDIY